jgi:hypothetical protein
VSTADELAKLVQLRDSGSLTEEEFQLGKARLLGQQAPSSFDLPPTGVSVASAAPASPKATSSKMAMNPLTKTVKNPLTKRGRRRFALVLGAIVVLIIVIVALTSSSKNGNSGNGTSAQTSSTPGAALTTYFKQVNTDLSQCVAGIGATQLELSQALGTNATQSDFVNLYTSAKQAEGPCDITQNNDLLNLGTLGAPSGYASLSNFSLDAQTWADSDSVTVLKDVEAVANAPSSTAAVATLISDSQTADADGEAVISAATAAAKQAGIKDIGGNMIVIWGLTTK